jgi:hypothetical protein
VVASESRVKLGRIGLLFLLVAALGAYIYRVEVPKAREEATKAKLVTAATDDVTAITLTFPDRELALRKQDGAWRLTAPIEAPADDAAVKSLLGTLSGAEIQRSLDELPADLAAFGLDHPSPVVRLATAKGDLPSIAIGKNAAVGGKTYARIGDEPKVRLIASTIRFALDKQPKDLRDKQLLTFKDDDVTRIDIAPSGGPPVTLVRKEKDAWLLEPGAQPTDITEIRSYLSSLRSARAIDFPDDPKDTGLDKPRLTVTVAVGSGPAQTLLIGNDITEGSQKQVFAKRGDQATVVTLGDWSFRTLGKDAWDFRDKTVLGFSDDRVGRIVMERKEGTGATFVHGQPGGWTVDGEKQSRGGAIQRFVDDLRELKGSSIAAEPAADLKRFGLDAPDLRFTVLDREQKPLGTVLLAKHDGKFFAVREGGSTVFEVRDYMYTRLDKQLRDFIGPEPARRRPPPAMKTHRATGPATTSRSTRSSAAARLRSAGRASGAATRVSADGRSR